MYKIHGVKDQSESEYDAATEIIEAAKSYYGSVLETSHELLLDVVVSIKALGEKNPDIDLTVLFIDGRKKRDTSLPHSFVCVVEVKEHSAENIQFEGGRASVKYKNQDQPHNASEQNWQQVFTLKNFVKRRNKKVSVPYITNAIYFRRLPNQLAPKDDCDNFLGRGFEWRDLTRIISMIMDNKSNEQRRKDPSLRNVDSSNLIFNTTLIYKEFLEVLNKRITISPLDRSRLEAITKQILEQRSQQYIEKLGTQLLIFRGRGGTGKTIALLQLAMRAYELLDSRVLFLTYNRALLSDLGRIFVHAGVKNISGGSGFGKSTLHSFFADWMRALDKEFGFLKKRNMRLEWDSLIAEFVEWVKTGSLSSEDIERIKRSDPTLLYWELLFIDESQDCEFYEPYLLYQLYGSEKCVIADGLDQLIRGHSHADWTAIDRQTITLSKSLRLKLNLCDGIGLIARGIGYGGWDVSPQVEAHGGSIEVLFGSIDRTPLVQHALEVCENSGNQPVDLLICTPLTENYTYFEEERYGKAKTRRSYISNAILNLNGSTWDAVDESVRDIGAENAETVRVVSYESCRGLEGWAVILEGLDVFFEDTKVKFAESTTLEKTDLLQTDEEWVTEAVNRTLMIPLTRAIDTLIVHIENRESFLGKVMQTLIDEQPEAFRELNFVGLNQK